MLPIIDAHIHLDLYEEDERIQMLNGLENDAIAGVVSVSMNLHSCKEQLRLKQMAPGKVHPAFGFHPEQPLPEEEELERLLHWIREHRAEMVAVGEVGLPYYTRRQAVERGRFFDLKPYVLLLERFVQLASELDMPIVLHAVYEDAETVCGMLESYGVRRAHFHWFKGSQEILEHMKTKEYFISVTPDVLYEPKIQNIVRMYPLELLMAETDGPWPFEGPFAGRRTHPTMIRDTIACIASIKNCSEQKIADALLANTRRFYQLP